MSFGLSIGDFILLTKLAYTTVQNARDACGVHDSLTKEVTSIHIILRRLEAEVSKPESILNKPVDNRKQELAELARGCRDVLQVLSKILEKYNALPIEKRRVTKLWQKIKFGNGEMQDLAKIRSELSTYTQAITIFFNLLSIGSQGKVERYMDSHGEELREIKHSLTWVTASLQANTHEEGSILTSYAEDDKAVWKSFRRELIKEGFSSDALGKHKKLIKRYISELCERGALDDVTEASSEADKTQAISLEGQKSHIQEASSSIAKTAIPSTTKIWIDTVNNRVTGRRSVSCGPAAIPGLCGGKENSFETENDESFIVATSPSLPQGRRLPQNNLGDAKVVEKTTKSQECLIHLAAQLSGPEVSEVAGDIMKIESRMCREETLENEEIASIATNDDNAEGQSLSSAKISDEESEFEKTSTSVEENVLETEPSKSFARSVSPPHDTVVHDVSGTTHESTGPDLLNDLRPTVVPGSSPTAAQAQNDPDPASASKRPSRYQAYVEDLEDEEFRPEAHPNCFSEEIDTNLVSDKEDQEDELVRRTSPKVPQHGRSQHEVPPLPTNIPCRLTARKLRRHDSFHRVQRSQLSIFTINPPVSTGGAATIGSDDENFSNADVSSDDEESSGDCYSSGGDATLGSDDENYLDKEKHSDDKEYLDDEDSLDSKVYPHDEDYSDIEIHRTQQGLAYDEMRMGSTLQSSAVSQIRRELVIQLAERLKRQVCPIQLYLFKNRMLKDNAPGIDYPTRSSNEAVDRNLPNESQLFPSRYNHRHIGQKTRSQLQSTGRNQRPVVSQRMVWISKPDESSFVKVGIANVIPATSQSYALP